MAVGARLAKAVIAKLIACKAMPQASRDAMQKAAAAIDQSWAAASAASSPDLKKMMGDSCKQGADAMKQTVTAMGC